jgi:hypothetical protein
LAFQGAAGYSGSLFFWLIVSSEIRMRAFIVVAGAALALTACGNNDQAGNTANIDDGLTAENIVSNDVTAIDAVTGEAANMAADMDINFTNALENGADNASTPISRPTTPRPTTGGQPGTSEAPTSNETATNVTANAE